MIEILFQDDHLVVVNKPPGLLVHRTAIAEEETLFLLQILRDQLGKYLYPIHRLDRPTSGAIAFAFSSEVASSFAQAMERDEVVKVYHSLVRGWVDEVVDLDYPVKNEKGKPREANSLFTPLGHIELPIAFGRYETSRYTILQCEPKTGRWHQLRQHLAHLRHYIINDRVHGDGKQNRLFTERLGLREMFLHARYLEFSHPVTQERVSLLADYPEHWSCFYDRCIELCGVQNSSSWGFCIKK
ncbi:MAG: pseudouridine synthase [Bacteroidales bacterium]